MFSPLRGSPYCGKNNSLFKNYEKLTEKYAQNLIITISVSWQQRIVSYLFSSRCLRDNHEECSHLNVPISYFSLSSCFWARKLKMTLQNNIGLLFLMFLSADVNKGQSIKKMCIRYNNSSFYNYPPSLFGLLLTICCFCYYTHSCFVAIFPLLRIKKK